MTLDMESPLFVHTSRALPTSPSSRPRHQRASPDRQARRQAAPTARISFSITEILKPDFGNGNSGSLQEKLDHREDQYEDNARDTPNTSNTSNTSDTQEQAERDTCKLSPISEPSTPSFGSASPPESPLLKDPAATLQSYYQLYQQRYAQYIYQQHGIAVTQVPITAALQHIGAGGPLPFGGAIPGALPGGIFGALPPPPAGSNTQCGPVPQHFQFPPTNPYLLANGHPGLNGGLNPVFPLPPSSMQPSSQHPSPHHQHPQHPSQHQHPSSQQHQRLLGFPPMGHHQPTIPAHHHSPARSELSPPSKTGSVAAKATDNVVPNFGSGSGSDRHHNQHHHPQQQQQQQQQQHTSKQRHYNPHNNQHTTSSSSLYPTTLHKKPSQPVHKASQRSSSPSQPSQRNHLDAPVPTSAAPRTQPPAEVPATGGKRTEGKDADDGQGDKNLWPAWVYCTRYSDRPSAGPRSRKTRKRDKPSSDSSTGSTGSTGSSSTGSTSGPDEKRPRTAFTNDQLEFLRREFGENKYLTEDRRQRLAKELDLTESQIKIWFQNKRAKLKKTSGTTNPLTLSLISQGLYNHTAASQSSSASTEDNNGDT